MNVLGKIAMAEAFLLLLPTAVSLFYGENSLPFLIPVVCLLVAACLLSLAKPHTKTIYAKEGFSIVAFSWLLMSIFGALPFVLSGDIPSYIDALFETVSGFTTTGSTILKDVESLSQGMLFWRSFTHWVGGMGVLVFVMAIIPLNDDQGMHIMRAEVPGPSVGKLVPKLSSTAKILYVIYLGLTLLEIVFLLCGGMPVFDSIVTAFGTAGTGGFSVKNASIAAYGSAYLEYVIAIFMFLFGVNFQLFYLILLRKLKDVFRDEELRLYFGIVAVSIVIIAVNIYPLYQNAADCLRYSTFQVSSIITTTGFSTIDYNTWPELSRSILVVLSLIGASAGSTGGGLKVSRVLIFFKSIKFEITRMLHPRTVRAVKINGKTLDANTLHGVNGYFLIYVFILFFAFLLVSLDGFSFETSFTSVVATFNNVGPGLDMVGPMGNFSQFSVLSKLVLSMCMLLGRLEIYPIILILAPSAWRRR